MRLQSINACKLRNLKTGTKFNGAYNCFDLTYCIAGSRLIALPERYEYTNLNFKNYSSNKVASYSICALFLKYILFSILSPL